jgi:FYVE/RhoGEF/PH domain-containing protein 5/6
MSTSQSFNTSSSNRNSIISAQSVSSESFDNDNHSSVVSDAENGDGGGTSNSSPMQSNHANANNETDDFSLPASTAVSSGIVDDSNTGKNCQQQQQQDHQHNNAKKLFYIAREIMTSEQVYVDVLRLLNIEFREFVQRARSESRSGLLPDADFVKLFSNLPELMMLNEDLLRDFEARVGSWNADDNEGAAKIADVIVRKGPYLKLYTVYIRDFSAMNFHFEEMCARYPKFGRLVREFEKLPRCGHLRLQHFMLKPVQRLPQYRLLLEDYLRHLDPHSPDFDDTAQALRIVSEAAEHANNTVKQGVSFPSFFSFCPL